MASAEVYIHVYSIMCFLPVLGKLFSLLSVCQGSGNIVCLLVHELELSERQQTLIAPLSALYGREEERKKHALHGSLPSLSSLSKPLEGRLFEWHE